VNVIAEFKRRSPSRGVIRDDLEAVQVAQAYEIGGAVALSVLTEEHFFGGSLDDLKEARAATLLPTLRKDFIVDPYQVWEALAVGADAILLIVAALSDIELRKLTATAREANLDVLVEVHDRDELLRAVDLGATIIGVNNRNLRTMAVDLQTAINLAPLIPDHVVAVAESGIGGSEDIRRLRDVGYDAFLIGEHLMKRLPSTARRARPPLASASHLDPPPPAPPPARWPPAAPAPGVRLGSAVARHACTAYVASRMHTPPSLAPRPEPAGRPPPPPPAPYAAPGLPPPAHRSPRPGPPRPRVVPASHPETPTGLPIAVTTPSRPSR
jgi:indole-3-glycerol phosphate synthase